MSAKTGIEWTDATWNPMRGCRRVSPGCEHCYAEKIAARFSKHGQPFHGFARRRSNGEAQWTGRAGVMEHKLSEPLGWKAPKRVFVNSMSDVFYEGFSDAEIAEVFAVMALASWHTFQVLTKRPKRASELLNSAAFVSLLDDKIEEWESVAYDAAQRAGQFDVHNRLTTDWAAQNHGKLPLPNVWLGTSVEDQERADERIPPLLRTPAAIRFLSCEPLLGPITFSRLHQYCPEHDFAGGFCTSYHDGVRFPDWIIVGGESGSAARPMDTAWVWSLIDQCSNANVAVFVKQLGAVPMMREDDWRAQNPTPLLNAHNRDRVPSGFVPLAQSEKKGGDMNEWPSDLRVREFPEPRVPA